MKRAQAPHNPLLAELKAVHAMLRRDLAACRQLAIAAANGAPTAQIRSGIKQLQTRGPLFQLRSNCIRHCHTVHAHHEGEDTGLFPTIRRAAPHMRATIDRLQADHRVVSDLLDQVEGLLRGLDVVGHEGAADGSGEILRVAAQVDADGQQHEDREHRQEDGQDRGAPTGRHGGAGY